MVKILTIIVYFSGKSDLTECLKSLEPTDFDINLIINSPNFVLWPTLKNELSQLKKEGRKITIITPSTNLGFAKGINVVLKKTIDDYDWFFLLNPDATLTKWDAKEKKAFYRASKNFDLFSAKVFNQNGTVWFEGGKINWLTGQVKHQKDSFDFLSGCALFVRSLVFKTIGFFDERFFLFYEDVDFSLRAKEKGFHLGLAAEIKVCHKVGQSVKNLPDVYQLESQSKFIFLNKHKSHFWPIAQVVSRLQKIKHEFKNQNWH